MTQGVREEIDRLLKANDIMMEVNHIGATKEEKMSQGVCKVVQSNQVA